jgi:queuosine biosynthesis protein QueD
MNAITFRHEVPFGHRLMFHEGKCRFPHGHNYIFEVTVQGLLDDNGMVMDFSELKKLIRGFFESFDHAFVLHWNDPLRKVMEDLNVGAVTDIETLRAGAAIRVPTKCVILNVHPTAENLAQLLAGAMRELRMHGGVTCFEQRDCSAHATTADASTPVKIIEQW